MRFDWEEIIGSSGDSEVEHEHISQCFARFNDGFPHHLGSSLFHHLAHALQKSPGFKIGTDDVFEVPFPYLSTDAGRAPVGRATDIYARQKSIKL